MPIPGARVFVPDPLAGRDPDAPLVRGTVVRPVTRAPRRGWHPVHTGYVVEIPNRGEHVYELAVCKFPPRAVS